ncbi:Pericentriolar material 1 protein isoform X2 [Oopsacas minuta]|uniref:Pericentriolar material 1 protein isoform X2 n=1 Tax=Oopsacas minuta TaxID=111878 RepID=A0AAV7JBH2_9METZ|nr:Pericentriolar material 1 protein isoform X2 [Oopsacas minuta]
MTQFLSIQQPHIPVATTPHGATFPSAPYSLPVTPYYQTAPPVLLSYPTPTPGFYPSSADANMYQSLPTPGPGPGPGPDPALHPVNQWIHEPRVPVTTSCTQTDLTFSDNMISSQHCVPLARDNLSRREVTPMHCYRKQPQQQVNAVPASPRRKSGHVTRHNSQKRVSPGVESPVLDQVRERIYSEVASLVRQNETRAYYMLELIRVAQLLNSDYVRECGLSCLKRVINDDENSCTQVSERLQVARRQESVYSPSQNVHLRHYYLNSNLSGSSENVDERSVSRAYQVSEALDSIHSLVDKPDDFEAIQIGVCDEDESDISEESLKECGENLDQFKEYKVKEFQEVLPNTSDEMEALSKSLSLLRIEYTDEKESRTKQGIQLSSVRKDKEVSRLYSQELVLQVEGYTKEIEELKTAGREREVLKDNQEVN